ncbi:MAG: ABC transporter ATP-binding protein [Candidatus Gastranaerophilales bacterium]|nr:ABC transporter ATP-binding protein [Candidatus Gastranaerophilales bacterium]
MINIKDLSLTVDKLTIFNSANINIPKDKITVLVGPNGVGKTTLLKLISGVIKPQSGTIEKNCKELFYLPQRIKYPQGITLQEYIESSFYKQNWKWFLSKEEKQKVSEVLELLELMDKKETLIDNLSSGELQKANIALGLVSNADVLLLDEPTSNMDLINQIKVLDIIKKLTQKGVSSIIVLHDINLSSSYGDYFVGISKERKIITAEKKDFIKAEILNEIFGINFKVINSEEDFHIQIFN